MDSEPNWIILEDYAKTLSVSPTAVKKAINNGRIPASAISFGNFGGRNGQNKRVFINKTEADIAWVNTENVSQGRRTPEAKAAVQRLREELSLNGENVQPAKKESKEKNMTLSEAQRREKIAKAEIAQIELLRLKGSLVQKDVVYKQLFEVSRTLRDKIMSVPDRILSEIVAAQGNQTQIRIILTEALALSLEELSNIKNISIG